MFILITFALLSFLPLAVFVFLWLSYKSPAGKPANDGITIIVAIRNEEKHIEALLKSLASQDYANEFEILLVLDRCTDRSLEIVKSFLGKIPELQVISIPEVPDGISPKKFVLNLAIRQAKFEMLAFTDADCRPPMTWLSQIHRHFGKDGEAVIGLSPYQKLPGLLNMFIGYETFITALQYAAFTIIGFPYMAVGRNLAYKKSFYRHAGGLEPHFQSLSGDDDLLINSAKKNGKIRLMLGQNTYPVSEPPMTWKQWIRQKMRHFSAAKSYSFGSQTLMVVLHGLHTGFYLSLLWELITGQNPLWVAAIWGGRAILAMGLLALVQDKWKDQRIVFAYPLLDLLYWLYYLLIGSAGLIRKPVWHKK